MNLHRTMRRRAVPAFSAALFVIVGGVYYGWVAHRYWNNPPRLTQNFTKDFNRGIEQYPPEQWAWPAYREALVDLRTNWPETWDGNPASIWTKPEVAQFIDASQETLESIRAASLRPTLGFPLLDRTQFNDLELIKGVAAKSVWISPSENPPLLKVLLHPIPTLWGLVSCLSADAFISYDRENAARATEDLLAIMNVADHLRDCNQVVSDAASVKMFGTAMNVWISLLSRQPFLFSDEHLQTLESRAMQYARGNLKVRLAGELQLFEDIVQRVYTDDGNGDGYLFLPEFLQLTSAGELAWTTKLGAPLTTMKFASRRQILEIHRELMELAESETTIPLWQQRPSGYKPRLLALQKDVRYNVLVWVPVNYDGVQHAAEYATQMRDAAIVASALVRFAKLHGHLPQQLEELQPKFIAAIPVDRFSGKPLKYLVEGQDARLYSVGEDQKDDHGRPGIIFAFGSDKVPAWETMFTNKRDELNPWAWEWTFEDRYLDNPADIGPGKSRSDDWLLWPIGDSRRPPLKPTPDSANGNSEARSTAESK